MFITIVEVSRIPVLILSQKFIKQLFKDLFIFLFMCENMWVYADISEMIFTELSIF